VTPERERQSQIDAGERWLTGVDVDPPTTDVEGLKRSVRVAALERWLASQDRLAPPQDMAARLKQGVRRECERLRRDGRRLAAFRKVRRWSAAAASLAACIAVVVLGTRPSHVAGPRVVSNAPAAALDRWMASLHGPMSEEDVSLALLEQEVRSLERSMTGPESAAIDVDAALMDDLFDDSERLLAELQDDIG